MDKRLPVVAHPGSATVSTVRRESGQPANLRHKPYASGQRQTRRAEFARRHEVFAGYTQDAREAEAWLKPDISWCEQNCLGLWSLQYGPYTKGMGYRIRFGFTDAVDARGFEAFRQARRRHSSEVESDANER